MCSNLFLTAQFELKIGRYADALAHSDKVMNMCESLKDELEPDYAIIASKFYMQQANIAFMHGDIQKAKDAAEKGFELVLQVDTKEADIREASSQTQRDLMNMLLRTRARLEKKDVRELRKEFSKTYGIGLTFLKTHDEHQKNNEDLHKMLKQ